MAWENQIKNYGLHNFQLSGEVENRIVGWKGKLIAGLLLTRGHFYE